MLQVKRFVNELMTSNCYVVYDVDTKKCIVIDPGSEKSEREISFIRSNSLELNYIFVTHEHTDHNWGVNSLYEAFENVKLVCTEECRKWVNKANRAYFLFYYDDPDYRYQMRQPDQLILSDEDKIFWDNKAISFFLVPGHSRGAMSILTDGLLFTGDTIMPFKPYFNGRDSNEDDWDASVMKLEKTLSPNIMIYPGHGDKLTFGDWLKDYCVRQSVKL